MNLKESLPEYHSQVETQRILHWIDGSPQRFAELMDIFFEGNTRKNQYAAGIMIHCIDRWPYLITPYIEKFILNLQNEGLHDAIKRNTVRVLQDVEIPENLHGVIAEICFNYLKKTLRRR